VAVEAERCPYAGAGLADDLSGSVRGSVRGAQGGLDDRMMKGSIVMAVGPRYGCGTCGPAPSRANSGWAIARRPARPGAGVAGHGEVEVRPGRAVQLPGQLVAPVGGPVERAQVGRDDDRSRLVADVRRTSRARLAHELTVLRWPAPPPGRATQPSRWTCPPARRRAGNSAPAALPAAAGKVRASYGFGAQTVRCAAGPVPVAEEGGARPGAGERWQREVLLAAFAAQVGEGKLDGGVGLEDPQAGHAVEVLLPASPTITGSARVEQGVPRQAEQAVKINQDHLGLVIVRMAGRAVSHRATARRCSRTSATGPLCGSAVTAGSGASDCQKTKTSISKPREIGQRRAGGEPAEGRLVLSHGRRRR
jgi:hypothetical protein